MGSPRCHILTEHDGLVWSPCELALRPGVLKAHGSKTRLRSIRYKYGIVVAVVVAHQIYRYGRRRTFFGSHCVSFSLRKAWRAQHGDVAASPS